MSVVLDLLEYWGDNPPMHVIEAAKAGLGKRRRRKSKGDEDVQPPRELTKEELAKEARLPAWVQKIRAQQREERKERAKHRDLNKE